MTDSTPTKRVYLAGPIAGLTYADATYGWRSKVISALHDYHSCSAPNDGTLHCMMAVNIHCYSPMRGKVFLKNTPDRILGKQGYEAHPMSSQQGIIGRDREDVFKADLIFMNVQGAKAVSIGTTIEMGWADAYRKPVVLVTDKEGNPHDHMFFKGLATYVCYDLEQAIECAKSLLIPSAE